MRGTSAEMPLAHVAKKSVFHNIINYTFVVFFKTEERITYLT
jgi:hypothetical protein